MVIVSPKSKLQLYLELMRFHKPIGTFLLLWPCLMALWIAAGGCPDPFILFIFIAGVVVMRALGCVINDILDRNFDGQVERTLLRPLATRQLSLTEALSLFFVLSILAFAIALQLNWQTILWSFVAFLLAVTYPLMKRLVGFLPQLVLGAAFACSIPMSFAALQQPFNLAVVYLYVATILWVYAYDTQYAMADRKDDRKIGIQSSALFFGRYDRTVIFFVQSLSFLLLGMLGNLLKLGAFYFLGIVAAACFALYQQYLIRNRKPCQCLKAFLNNNYLGASLFLGLVLNYSLR